MKASLPQTLLVLVVLVVLVAAQQLFSLPGGSAVMRAAQDAMHAPWFFAVVVVLCWWLRGLAWPVRLLAVAVLGTLLATGTEFVQLYVEDRSASMGDLRRNLVGGVLGLIFASALLRGSAPGSVTVAGSARFRFTPLALGIGAMAVLALVIYAALPPWQALELRRYRAELAPVIVDLADARTAQFLQTNDDSWFRTGYASEQWPRYQGQPVLRLEFGASEYPTLYVSELMQRWASYDELAVDVFALDGEPLPLTLAVRYEGSYGTSAYYESMLVPGENLLRIPRSKFLPDEATALRVEDLLVYTTAEHAGRAVLIGAIRMQ